MISCYTSKKFALRQTLKDTQPIRRCYTFTQGSRTLESNFLPTFLHRYQKWKFLFLLPFRHQWLHLRVRVVSDIWSNGITLNNSTHTMDTKPVDTPTMDTHETRTRIMDTFKTESHALIICKATQSNTVDARHSRPTNVTSGSGTTCHATSTITLCNRNCFHVILCRTRTTWILVLKKLRVSMCWIFIVDFCFRFCTVSQCWFISCIWQTNLLCDNISIWCIYNQPKYRKISNISPRM